MTGATESNEAKPQGNSLFETLGRDLNPSRALEDLKQIMKDPLFTEADKQRFKNNKSRFENSTDLELQNQAKFGI
jgi:hypothetical protein